MEKTAKREKGESMFFKLVFPAAAAGLVVLLCGMSGVAYLHGAEQQQPNLIFIVVDDLRWDELGCAGHPFVKTPHIDRIAREGICSGMPS